MLKNKILSCLGGGVEKDPNFSNTVLLLHGDGTNGAQNNTFVDSSANNFTITRSGNTTQGSFSPFSKEPGEWGVSFDGSGDYLIPSASTSLNLGTGAFTIEAWINIAGSYSSYQTVYLCGPGREDGFYFNKGDLVFYTTGVGVALRFGTIQQGVWTHIAATRDSSNNLRLFVNGVASAATTYTFNLNDNQPHIGANKDSTPGEFLNGAISNLRVVKGTALYTANFTPPTEPLTAVAGTSLLCCQDNRFKDNSPNNFTLTPYGNVAVTPFSPFANSAAWLASVNGGSGYFDGNADYLRWNPSHAVSGDFTLEGWFYRCDGSDAIVVSGNSAPGTNQNIQVLRFGESGSPKKLSCYLDATSYSSDNVVPIKQWFHCAMVRQSGTIRIYIDGNNALQFTNGNSIPITTLGIFDYGGSPYQGFYGYISNFRIVKGTAVYTANFTPPTAPLTAVTNTSLLLNFTNAGIYDNTGMNNLETVGNAQVSTAQKKFGTGAMYFQGTVADYISGGYNTPQPVFLGKTFTIEFWIYRTGTASNQWIVESGQGYNVPGGGFLIGYYTVYAGGSIAIAGGGLGAYWFGGNTQVTANTWHHVAVVGDGANCIIYLNGVNIGSSAWPGGYSGVLFNGINLGVGFQDRPQNMSPNAPFQGYIDDLRITKGVARYTANFTPPSSAFPNK